MSDLAQSIDLSDKLETRKDRIAECGIGRNISLFDELREWAYVAIRDYWFPGGFNIWQSEVIDKADGLNQFFAVPLPYSEIESTAKSVANEYGNTLHLLVDGTLFSERIHQRCRQCVEENLAQLELLKQRKTL
ncbi:MAG: hypothetical protein ACXWUD_09830 [Methylosarcina sp.]